MTTIVLPDGPTAPRIVQGVLALRDRRGALRNLQAKYGSAFTIDVFPFGKAVVLSDPAEVRELFTSNPDVFGMVEPNLGRILGPGSLFALDGTAHKAQRKLLVPPFHGRRLGVYDTLIEEEAVKEMATWPEDEEFPVLESMMKITLNAILRAVFGAEGAEFDQLRELLPRFVDLGAKLAVVPVPQSDFFGLAPWGRFRRYRAEYDALVDRLIDKAEGDSNLSDRDDVLAMMIQSTYEDGTRMSRSDVADELLTLLTAGHETTATSLAWAVERLRRHPEILARLVEEVRKGGTQLREATITEVQRTRPVIDGTGRQVKTDGAKLGRWTFPKGQVVVASIGLMHQNENLFPNPNRFYPDRFINAKADNYAWIPFGGGVRRCIGAAFAQMEMNVVLRTLLRDFELAPTNAPDEAWHSRGIAFAPKDGGLAVVHRRPEPLFKPEEPAADESPTEKVAEAPVSESTIGTPPPPATAADLAGGAEEPAEVLPTEQPTLEPVSEAPSGSEGEPGRTDSDGTVASRWAKDNEGTQDPVAETTPADETTETENNAEVNA